MNKNKTKELLELRDLLNKVISNTNKYNKQKDKSPTTDLRLNHHGGDDITEAVIPE